MTTLKPSTLIERSPEVLGSVLNDELVMVDAMTGKYYGLGGTGPRLWELLEQPMTVGELVDRLVAEYAVDERLCREETVRYLQQLHEAGLVRMAV